MKRVGFSGTATMKMISKTSRTSISGVTLINGGGVQSLIRFIGVPPDFNHGLRHVGKQELPAKASTRVSFWKSDAIRFGAQPGEKFLHQPVLHAASFLRRNEIT